MKIDEPKTPYVTDEEYQKLCEDDPDFQKEFGKKSQEGSDVEIEDGLILAEANMKLNMNMNVNMDAGSQGSAEEQIPKQGAQPSFNPAAFDIGSLADKLGEVADADEEAERKKKEFDEKRKKHYAKEF